MALKTEHYGLHQSAMWTEARLDYNSQHAATQQKSPFRSRTKGLGRFQSQQPEARIEIFTDKAVPTSRMTSGLISVSVCTAASVLVIPACRQANHHEHVNYITDERHWLLKL